MAELHIIGEILGAEGFSSKNVFCKWELVTGQGFEHLEGVTQGQTQLDAGQENDMAVWSHPLDVHYAVKGLSGWPKLSLQVWCQDIHGRNDICGYGFCHIPTKPGIFDIECPTWLPEGTLMERVSAFFIGGNVRLRVEEVTHMPQDRCRLRTVAAGVVHVHLGLIMKSFDEHHVIFG